MTQRDALRQQEKPRIPISLSAILIGPLRERNALYSFFPHFLKIFVSMLLKSQNFSTFYTWHSKAGVENTAGHSNLPVMQAEGSSRVISPQYEDVIYVSALLPCTSAQAVPCFALMQTVIYIKVSVLILLTDLPVYF